MLPPQLRKRMIVITLAPASFISSEMANQVVNLYIPHDPIVGVASNRHLMDSPNTMKLPSHSDHSDPHYSDGQSYRENLAAMIDCYIRTNDIVEKKSIGH